MNKHKTLPTFANEAEERAFWETHDSTDYLDWRSAQKVVLPELKPTTKTISLRLPQHLLDSIKAAANARDVPYQSLIKVWLQEKLAQCRFEWNLTGHIFPAQPRCSLASRHSNGVFGAVKGGRRPAQRILDGIENVFTLKGLGLDAGLASGPRARPAARTSPPSGGGVRGGGIHTIWQHHVSAAA